MWLNAKEEHDIACGVVISPHINLISWPSNGAQLTIRHLYVGTLDGEVVQRVGFDFADGDAMFVIKERFDCRTCGAGHVEPAFQGNDHDWVAQGKDCLSIKGEDLFDGRCEIVGHLASCSMT